MNELNKLMEESIQQIISCNEVVEPDPNVPDSEQSSSVGRTASSPPSCENLNNFDLHDEAAVLQIVEGAASKAIHYPKVSILNDEDESRSFDSDALYIDESVPSETENPANNEVSVIQQVEPIEEPYDQFLLDLIALDTQQFEFNTEVFAQNQVALMDSKCIGPMAPPIDLLHNGNICRNVQGPIPDFMDFNEYKANDDNNIDVSICFSYSKFDNSSNDETNDDDEKRMNIYQLTQNPFSFESNPNQTPPRTTPNSTFTYNFVCVKNSNLQDVTTLNACAVMSNNFLSKFSYPYERYRLSSRNLEIVDEIISKYITDCFGENTDLFRNSRCIQYGPSRNFVNISMHVNPRRLLMRDSGEPISFYHFESNTVVIQLPFPNQEKNIDKNEINAKTGVKNTRRYHATFPNNLNMQIKKRHEIARKLVASIFEMEKKNVFAENRNSGRGERRLSRMLGQPINLRFSLCTSVISENTTIPFEANHCIDEVIEEEFDEIGLDLTFKDMDVKSEENIASTSGGSERKYFAIHVDEEERSAPIDEGAIISEIIKNVDGDAGDESNDDAGSDDEIASGFSLPE